MSNAFWSRNKQHTLHSIVTACSVATLDTFRTFWTSFDLARFGIEIRIKHDSPASTTDDSFSGDISLSNSSNKFSFSAIMSFDSASFAIVSKTLADAIFDSVLPCCTT
ncbi:hypothetical protein ACB092_12G205900 [Castanea dentata]